MYIIFENKALKFYNGLRLNFAQIFESFFFN